MAKTVLVTGANRGIGLEVCRQLLERGFDVLLGARKEQAGQRALRELGGRVTAVVLDVAQTGSVDELARRAEREGWRLQALINNAGVSLRGFDADVAAETLETNLFGAMRVADALLPMLDDGGSIVNVSSGMGELSVLGPERRRQFEGVLDRKRLLELMNEFVADVRAKRHTERGWPSNAYSVSKIGLNVFTRLLAREQPRLRVNSVCPGWVRTDLGGQSAPRSVEQGARGIVWAATLDANGPTGGFFRDRQELAW